MYLSENQTLLCGHYAKLEPVDRVTAVLDWLDDDKFENLSGTNIAQENFRIFASNRILNGQWQEDDARQWRFVDLAHLADSQSDSLPEQGENAWQLVSKRVKQADKKTYQDFHHLQAAFEKDAIRNNPTIDYVRWAYYYLPYLTLDLPAGEAGKKEFNRRAQWFIEPVQGHEVYEQNLLRHIDRYDMGWVEKSRTQVA